MVAVTDKDLRTALHFMVSFVLIEDMNQDMISDPQNLKDYCLNYKDKINTYKPTIDGMLEEFLASIFGTHYNYTNRESFVDILASKGW